MMKKPTFLLLLWAWMTAGYAMAQEPQTACMDLAGLWRFQLDPMGFGKTPGSELFLKKLSGSILLPGSTDQAGAGIRNDAAYIDRLSRKYEYLGAAWYQREVVIPEEWKGKEIILTLERCHWETTVYVDGKAVGADERLSVPNRFILSGQLTPGTHNITICVDNRLKYPMDQWNHGTTEYTQTNWNGMVGKMVLEAKPSVYLNEIDIFPSAQAGNASIRADIRNNGKKGNGTLEVVIREKKGGEEVFRAEWPVTWNEEDNLTTIEQEIVPKQPWKTWDEFSPTLYLLETRLSSENGTDQKSCSFGVREVEQGEHHIRLNGRNIHLRGVLDCAAFPLTGYPATDTATWKRIFRTIKEYGMNHVRFHSWCPPEAAFTAADEVGLYVQAELPMWIKDVGKYPARRDFFEKEMYAILKEYGHHPSFILMCNGNENEGDFAVLEDLVRKAQEYDNRRLYSASTARTHVKADQYYVSHVTEKGWITVYEGNPSTEWDRREESDIDVPVIAHETGQRCMYPNFDEMKKYTGVLEPRNFGIFRERLAKNGMLHQARDFFLASGAHTVLQYKAVNEALLRTPNSGGFQLLGLADFPGQGSAFVGVLDAFWESKGLVTPEKFRESCAPTVILARFPKRVFRNNEKFEATLELYHYGPKPVKNGTLLWKLVNEEGTTAAEGEIKRIQIPCAVTDTLGKISIALNNMEKAGKYTLQTVLNDTVRNEWNIWVYPQQQQPEPQGVLIACQWNEQVREALRNGENVLLIPENAPGRKARFASHFWNPIMFNWAPNIVGTLIDQKHPCFSLFPTEYYADWQWWDILNHATAIDLTEMRHITPVIQSIDTYEHNRKLGIAWEAHVAKGNLFVLSIDIRKEMEQRPASLQLLNSIKQYVASEQFAPKTTVAEHEIDALFAAPANEGKENGTSAAVKQLLNQ